MKVEIWSDVVCPWCAIGKRRFEAALRDFAAAEQVEVIWRSFELDPGAPAELTEDLATHLASKYRIPREQALAMQASTAAAAAQEDLAFHFDRARSGNTFDAHRVLHLARDRGVQGAVKEALFASYFTEGEPIGQTEALIRAGVRGGLDADEVRSVLAEGKYADDVRADEQQARELGITGVPFFVLDGRYGISGAQPATVLLQALEQAWKEHSPLTVLGGAGDDCADGSCAAPAPGLPGV